ncbi:MAG: metallophosphoesterase family protein [Tsuneonella sp.]
MFEPLRQIFRARQKARYAAVPAGERYYLVGDIHGRLDLFERLIEAIEHDDREQPPARTTVVLLGDLVDRGPDSAGVIARARDWQGERAVRILAGNHEEMFLQSFDDLRVLRNFLRHGGRETVLSYGIDREQYNDAGLEELQSLMVAAVPPADIAFLESFEDYIVAGDYVFVHAGIDPALPIEQQGRENLLWIRERFLRHDEPHSHVVVHGHTIFEAVDERHNRIGIDTGAFKTGRLTALVLEGSTRRFIQTVEQEDGAIAIHTATGE